MTSLENLWFFDDFRGNRCYLTRSDLLNSFDTAGLEPTGPMT